MFLYHTGKWIYDKIKMLNKRILDKEKYDELVAKHIMFKDMSADSFLV